jgi:hypothetical protein
MFRKMLEEDRLRPGWSFGQAAWHLGMGVREYREIEAGERWPNWETFHRAATSVIRRESFRLISEG